MLYDALINVAYLNNLAYFRKVFVAVELAALEVIAEYQVFLYCHIEVERGLLGKIADVLFCLERRFEYIKSGD